jgi:hypothetical protein
MRQHIDRGGMDGPTFEQAMAASRDFDTRRRTLAATAREQARITETTTRRVAVRRAEAERLRAEIATKERVIAEAEQGLGNERVQLAQSIARQRG